MSRDQLALSLNLGIFRTVDFAACDVKTGFKREKNSETGEKATSATVQVADIKLAGSTSKHSKSLDSAAGDVKTGFQQQKCLDWRDSDFCRF